MLTGKIISYSEILVYIQSFLSLSFKNVLEYINVSAKHLMTVSNQLPLTVDLIFHVAFVLPQLSRHINYPKILKSVHNLEDQNSS